MDTQNNAAGVPTHAARRWCKGDAEWTSWSFINAEEYERRKDDTSFKFVPLAPAPADQQGQEPRTVYASDGEFLGIARRSCVPAKPVAATAEPVAHVVDGLEGMWARLVESADLPEGTPLYATPVAPAVIDIKLRSFRAEHDKQWCVVVEHPYGTSWVRMRDPLDIKLAELLAAAPAAPVAAKTDIGIPASARADFIERIVLSVAEQPDLTSPDDYPEHMLVTGRALRNMIESAFEAFDEDAELARGAAPVVEVLTDERASIPAWQDRITARHPNSDSRYWPDDLKCKYMASEIADLRAALTTQTNMENSNGN